MSDNLYKILEIENDLIDLYYDNKKIDTDEEKKIISKLDRLLKKLNNMELIYLLKNGTAIHKAIDILIYFKEYKINKKEIKENNSYKEELTKLNRFIDSISDAVWNENEYMYICSKCKVDDVADYLLKNMSNEDIMSLSNDSSDWNYKLFLYGNLKA